MFGKRSVRPEITYDPETQYPVFLSSICTGEKAAGFRNRADRKFTEVMVIRSEKDEALFKKMYGLGEVKTEY